jgi:hypothetical protein
MSVSTFEAERAAHTILLGQYYEVIYEYVQGKLYHGFTDTTCFTITVGSLGGKGMK